MGKMSGGGGISLGRITPTRGAEDPETDVLELAQREQARLRGLLGIAAPLAPSAPVATSAPVAPSAEPDGSNGVAAEDKMQAHPATPVARTPDMSAYNAYMRMAPEGYTGKIQMPVTMNEDVIRETLKRTAQANLVQSLLGTQTLTSYGAKLGLKPGQQIDPGGWNQVYSQINGPMAMEHARVANMNNTRDLLNKFTMNAGDAAAQDRKMAFDLAEKKSVATAAAKTMQSAEDKADDDRDANAASDANKALSGVNLANINGEWRMKAARAMGQRKYDAPASSSDNARIGAMRNVSDNMNVVSDMINRYGSKASLFDKIGKGSRGLGVLNQVGGMLGMSPIMSSDPETASLQKDAQRYEGAMGGVIGYTTVGTEPRRIAQEQQEIVNKQFLGNGADADVMREGYGRVAAHIARDYEMDYNAHPTFMKNSNQPTPAQFKAKIMRGLRAPPEDYLPPSAPAESEPDLQKIDDLLNR